MIKSKKQNSKIAVKKKTTSKKQTKKTKRKRAKYDCLLPEHIEFICWEIAEFRGKIITTSCIAKFPDYPKADESKRRAWWKSKIFRHFPRDKFYNPTDDCIYKDKIASYRKEYTSNIKESVALAHAKERLKILQQIVELAMEEKTIRFQSVKQVKTVQKPEKKDKDGNVTYKNVRATEYVLVPIKGRDLDVARRTLETIRVESGDSQPQPDTLPAEITLHRKVIDTDNSKYKIILPEKKHAN